jgi:hypothetical protein
MKTLTTTQGKQIEVSEIVYNALRLHFLEGDWMNCIKDICGYSHMIELAENFKYE